MKLDNPDKYHVEGPVHNIDKVSHAKLAHWFPHFQVR